MRCMKCSEEALYVADGYSICKKCYNDGKEDWEQIQ